MLFTYMVINEFLTENFVKLMLWTTRALVGQIFAPAAQGSSCKILTSAFAICIPCKLLPWSGMEWLIYVVNIDLNVGYVFYMYDTAELFRLNKGYIWFNKSFVYELDHNKRHNTVNSKDSNQIIV